MSHFGKCNVCNVIIKLCIHNSWSVGLKKKKKKKKTKKKKKKKKKNWTALVVRMGFEPI